MLLLPLAYGASCIKPLQGNGRSRPVHDIARFAPLLVLQALLLCSPALSGTQVHAAGLSPPSQPATRLTGFPPQKTPLPVGAFPSHSNSLSPTLPPRQGERASLEVLPEPEASGPPADVELPPSPSSSPAARPLAALVPTGSPPDVEPSWAPEPGSPTHPPKVEPSGAPPPKVEPSGAPPPKLPTQAAGQPLEAEPPAGQALLADPTPSPMMNEDRGPPPPEVPYPPVHPSSPSLPPPIPPAPLKPLAFTRGDLRLVNGSTVSEGRLEMFDGKAFRTICDDRFTDAAAAVACRQLGWSPEGATALCCGAYGSGDGRILLDEVTCTGAEARLEHCEHSGWGRHDCRADEAVAVRCNGTELEAPPPPPAVVPGTWQVSRNISDSPPVRGMMSSSGDFTGRLRVFPRNLSVEAGTRNLEYRVVYVYSDGAHSCPSPLTVPAIKRSWFDAVNVTVELSRSCQALRNNNVGGLQRDIVLQRKGFVGDTGSAYWLNSTWMDVQYMTTWGASSCSVLSPMSRVLQCSDKALNDTGGGNPESSGPVVVGWRWKHGSIGRTDGYVAASEFPELEAGKDSEGLNSTYQLVYLFNKGMFSYPGRLRFPVVHPSASTPITLYVQLESGKHPSSMSELHLQRVEGDHVWTVDVLTPKSLQLRRGLQTLTFMDRTSRSLSGCPLQKPLAAPTTSHGFPLPGQPLPPSSTDILPAIRTTASRAACALPPEVDLQLFPTQQQRQGQLRLQPDYRCRLVLRGWEQQGQPSGGDTAPVEVQSVLRQPGSSRFSHASLHCGASGSFDGPLGLLDASVTASKPGVQVELGGQLDAALRARNGSVSGVHVMAGIRSAEDWGITFTDVEHLTLMDSVVTGLPMSPYDSLIRCRNCGAFNMDNVTITGSSAADDYQGPSTTSKPLNGAIWAQVLENAILSNVTCTDIRASNRWACMRMTFQASARSSGQPSLVVRGCRFLHNIVSNSGSSATMSTADSYGAVLLESASTGLQPVVNLLVEGTQLVGNQGSQGAAITSLTALGTVVIRGSLLSENKAFGDGGAMSFAQGVSRFIITGGSSLYRNMAAGSGGASWTNGVTAVQVLALYNYSTVEENVAGQNGGAFAFYPPIETILVAGHSSLSGNNASQDGGGAFAAANIRLFCVTNGSHADYNMALLGGGLYIGNQTILSATDIIVSSNSTANHNHGGLLVAPYRQLGDVIIANNSHCDYNMGQYILHAESIVSITVSWNSSVSYNAGSERNIWASISIGEILLEDGGSMSHNFVENEAQSTNFCGGVTSAGYFVGRVNLLNGSTVTNNTCAKGHGGFLATTVLGSLVVTSGAKMLGNAAGAGCGGAIAVAMVMEHVRVVEGSVVSDNTAQKGGALCVTGDMLGDIVVDNASTVEANVAATASGGFMYVGGSLYGTVRVSNRSRVSLNIASKSGGAIYVEDSIYGGVDVTSGSNLAGNVASSGNGGAISAKVSIAGLHVAGGSSVSGNRAGASGGAFWIGGQLSELVAEEGSQLVKNKAHASGGAVSADLIGSVKLSSNASVLNNMAGSDGGAISASRIGHILLADITAADNTAGGSGGFMSVGTIPRSLEIRGCQFRHNNAERGSGGVLHISVPSPGTPLAPQLLERPRVLSYSVQGSHFWENGAQLSGGVINIVATTGSDDPTGKDSNLAQTPLTLHVGSCTFQANFASAGGALSIVTPAIGAIHFSLHVEGCDFWGNTAAGILFDSSFKGITGSGGAILVGSPPKFTYAMQTNVSEPWLPSSDAEWARVSEGGGSSVDGYGPDMHCQMKLEGSTFTYNRCTKSGGAVAAMSCLSNVHGCQFTGNSVGGFGGALAFLLDNPGATISYGATSNMQGYQDASSMERRMLARQVLEARSSLTPSRRRSGHYQLNRHKLLDAAAVKAEDYWSLGWSLLVWNSTFSNNSARGECAGALFAEAVLGAGIQMHAVNFHGNQAATSSGGAVCVVPHCDGARAIIKGGRFAFNAAFNRGGAVYVNMTDGISSVVRMELCELFSNAASSGGALAVEALAGSRLELVASNAANNTAGGRGGAMTMMCVANADSSDETGHTSADITNSQYTAGPGGAGHTFAASRACSSNSTVTITGGNFHANQALTGSGGAVYLSSYTSATVLRTTFSANKAGDSGGSIAGEACGQLLVAESNLTSSSAGQFGGGLFAHSCDLVTLYDVVIEDCQAQTGGGACLAGPSGDGSILQLGQGLGAHNFSLLPAAAVLYKVAFRRNKADTTSDSMAQYKRYTRHGGALFSHGNVSTVMVSSHLGYNSALVGAAIALTQTCATGPAKHAATAIDKVFEALPDTNLSKLLLSGLFGGGDFAESLDTLRTLTSAGACWPVLLSNSFLDQHEGVPLWSQDGSASAFFVRCSAATAQHASVDCHGQEQVPSSVCELAAHMAACGMLHQPTSTPQHTSSSMDNALILLGSPPTHMRLMAPAGAPLQLRPGIAFAISVVFHSSLGLPVQTAILPYKVSVSLEPAVPEWDNSFSTVITEAKRPWQDTSIGNLDPGLSEGSSLMVDLLTGNTASWPRLLARGWPGRYMLTFKALSIVDRGLYEIPPLRVDVDLTACRTGETLDLSWAQSDGNPWSACRECSRNTYGLWRDSRMPLWSINNSNYRTGMMAALNAAANGPAACVACPSAGKAACPGGPVVVPEPGYWHSAPDSPRIHRCPLLEACGVGHEWHWTEMAQRLQVGTTSTASSTDIGGSARSARTRWLIECQQGGYKQQFSSIADMLTSASANRSNDTHQYGFPGCQLWNVPNGIPTSYMQQQCSPGFTGRLCATCKPHYYLTIDFDCQSCPGLAKTIVMGTVCFIANLVLVLYTSLTNIKENYSPEDADDVAASDILKVLIVHVQYFIIVGRLPVDYPDSIAKCLNAAAAIVGATNVAAYSPSCLFPSQHSQGQARAQVLGALMTPCLVTAAALLVWTVRYYFLSRSKVRRAKSIEPNAAAAVRQAAAMQSASPPYRSGENWQVETSTAALESCPSIRIRAEPANLQCTTGLPTADSRSRPSVFISLAAVSVRPIVSGRQPFADVAPGASSGPPLAGLTARLSSATPAADVQLLTASASQSSRSGNQTLARLKRAVSTAIYGSLADSHTALTRLDQAMSLQKQLGIVLMAAIFILYPSWAQAALSIFTCYKIDDGTGPFAERQKATWRHGYWVHDMNQECYSGVHLWFYVPLGIGFLAVFCLTPPLASFIILWCNRQRISDTEFKEWYGFLYRRYRPTFFYWESVVQFQALSLVAVQVFGQVMAVTQQMLTMLLVFSAVSVVNISCRALRTGFLVLLEFFSLSALSVTITLSLFFTIQEKLDTAERNFVGVIILIINAGVVLIYVCGLVKEHGRALWERVSSMRQFWRSASSGRHRSSRSTSLETGNTQSPSSGGSLRRNSWERDGAPSPDVCVAE